MIAPNSAPVHRSVQGRSPSVIIRNEMKNRPKLTMIEIT